MDNQLLGILTLLRSALKEETLKLPEDFDWNLASETLYKHHLTALGLRGATRCGVPRTEPAIRQMTALFCKEIPKSRLQTNMLEALCALFRENNIDYLMVKGAVLKSLYPQRELRAMGDADILIRQEQYPAIRELLPRVGLETLQTETDYEYIWQSGDFKLELHKHLIPPDDRDYFAYYGDGWHLARKDPLTGTWTLGPEDHFIYLLVHFAKHYRHGSISAKSVCDFWVFRKAYPRMDEAYLTAELGKLKLLAFYRNILDTLDTWFEGAPPTEAVETLTRVVFQGGIYPHEETMEILAVLRRVNAQKSFFGSKFGLFLKKVFPPAKVLAEGYPILSRAPVLLPFIWILRAFEILFLHPQRRKNSLDSSRKLMHMDRDKIEDYAARLRSVGLEFSDPR